MIDPAPAPVRLGEGRGRARTVDRGVDEDPRAVAGHACRERTPGEDDGGQHSGRARRAPAAGRPRAASIRAPAAQPSSALGRFRPIAGSAYAVGAGSGPAAGGTGAEGRRAGVRRGGGRRPAGFRRSRLRGRGDRSRGGLWFAAARVVSIAVATSGVWGRVTTADVAAVATAALSAAISAGVSPSTPTCSAKISVIATTAGGNRPASSDDAAHARLQHDRVRAGVTRVQEAGEGEQAARRQVARLVCGGSDRGRLGEPAGRAPASSSPEIAAPSTRMRSVSRRSAGLVTVTTRRPRAASHAEAYVAAVPLPFEPTTVSTGARGRGRRAAPPAGPRGVTSRRSPARPRSFHSA